MMNKEITIPTSLHEITLDQYIKLVKVDLEDEENVIYDSMNAIFGFTREVVDAMTQATVENLAGKIKSITEQEYQPMYKFTINKVEYGMIPDFTDESVKFKEFADASVHVDNILNGTLEPDSFKRFMAVIFRPIIKNENGLIEIEPYENSDKHYEVMGKAPASAFKGAESFFLTLRTDLLRCSLTYMQKGEAVEIQALENHLMNSGDGMEALETLRSLAVKH